MAGPTNAQEAAMLDAALDVAGNTLHLYTVAPADDGTGGTEVSGGSYASVAIAATDWDAAVGGAPSTKTGPKSGVTWKFPTPTGDWSSGADIPYFVIKDSGAAVIWVGTLDSVIQVHSGDQPPQFDSSNQVTAQLGDPSDTF